MLREAAEAHYQPGRFTTFMAYECSSMPDMAEPAPQRGVLRHSRAGAPLHRHGFQPARGSLGLDRRLARTRVASSPSRSRRTRTGSYGLMYPLEDFLGRPLDTAYADLRMRNEPLTEMSQFKGTSETHPRLATNDEFADSRSGTRGRRADPDRAGRRRLCAPCAARGLLLADTQGFNPYRIGMIGSSDTHNSSSAIEENNFSGGHGNADATPQKRLHGKASTLALASTTSARRGSPASGPRRTRARRSSMRCAGARPSPPPARGSRVRFFAGTDLRRRRADADRCAGRLRGRRADGRRAALRSGLARVPGVGRHGPRGHQAAAGPDRQGLVGERQRARGDP